MRGAPNKREHSPSRAIMERMRRAWSTKFRALRINLLVGAFKEPLDAASQVVGPVFVRYHRHGLHDFDQALLILARQEPTSHREREPFPSVRFQFGQEPLFENSLSQNAAHTTERDVSRSGNRRQDLFGGRVPLPLKGVDGNALTQICEDNSLFFRGRLFYQSACFVCQFAHLGGLPAGSGVNSSTSLRWTKTRPPILRTGSRPFLTNMEIA